MQQIDFYRSLLASDPALASVRADLARSLLGAGDLDGAALEASAALDGDDASIQALLVRATVRKAQCSFALAADDFERAAALWPDRPTILVNLANTYAELDRLDDAERCLRRAVALSPHCTEAQASLGSVLVKQGNLAEAETACHAALALDPSLVGAHQNLSGILAATDPASARAHRDAAYGRQQLFLQPAPRTGRTILVLAAADAANVPLRHLMPRERVSLIHWYIEYATPDQDRALPPFDLIFNAIGDPDFAPALAPPVARLLREWPHHVLNDPSSVARTRRSDLPERLAGLPGIVVPPVICHRGGDGTLGDTMTFPVLVRPLGSHGGFGLRKIDGAAELPGGYCYITKFIDFRSADGWYRKYRMIFVDRKPYPYHLAIAEHWLVHHCTAAMGQDPARLEEERDFLADPVQAIGSAAMAALVSIGARLGLDYAGIDFGILPDGRVLVFEANATMLIHPEDDPRFAYRNAAVGAIQSAFDTLLDRMQAA